jgi:hypothetical protein
MQWGGAGGTGPHCIQPPSCLCRASLIGA